MKLVYIASPLRADTAGEMEENRRKAIEYCEQAKNLGTLKNQLIVPLSPISNFQYIDESKPEERQIALNMGLALLSRCDELWVAGDKITEGMRGELRAAVRMDIPVLSMGMENEKIMEAIGESQPLRTAENCIKGSNRNNYDGKLLILKPEALSQWCRSPDNQLCICTHDNGEGQSKIGWVSVYVQNLMHGIYEHWDRNDFLGVANSKKLPDWATDKLKELSKQDEQDNNFEMEEE